MYRYVLPLILLAFASCSDKKQETLFELVDDSGISFTNKISDTRDFNIFSYRNFYNGGGVAIGDINNDGLADVFFTANMGANKLFLNKGNFKFDDISEKSGFKEKTKWSTGVVFVDINNDGWLDIYVCNAGYQQGVTNENELYINNKDLTFTESAKQYGLDESGYTTHAAFFDYDLDGDLDCYVLKNSFIPVNTLNYANKRDLRAEDWPVADFLKGGGDKLLKNDNGKFVDVSDEAGIYGSLIGFGLGVTVGDVNGDLYPDMYISNDFFERDYLYINQKNGTFKEDLEQCMQHTSLASMGADMGDINNDGYVDIFTTDMLPSDDYRLRTTSSFDNIDVYKLKERSGFYHQFQQNTLQVNNRNGKFLETAFYSGVAASDWSWGALMFDADNDGLSDIFVCNGIYHDVTDQDFIDFFSNDVIQQMVLTGKKEEQDNIVKKMPSNPIPNMAFKNLGNLRFNDEAENWGLGQKSFSNGAAYGDLDNDGDLDLVINNVNQPSFVYRNNSVQMGGGNYLTVSLQSQEKQNVNAIGSIIKLFYRDDILSRDLMPSRGFQSSIDYKMHFGLGKREAPDSMVILWPDRSKTVVQSPAINRHHKILKSNSIPVNIPDTSFSASKMFTQVSHSFKAHKEDDQIDFYNERNIPFLLSREGPASAVADVNGDGLEDIFIGGAVGQGGTMYLQNNKGFKGAPLDPYPAYEDVAAAFFDYDNDKDPDLVVGSGGNHRQHSSPELQTRLYNNDGTGKFTIVSNVLPLTGMNASIVLPLDYDTDGDEDLFVGSRSVPMNYGLDAPSFIFRNDGNGKFSDVTKSLAPAFTNAGMITSATWSDINADGRKELIIVGEWMAPRIFGFNGQRFDEKKSGLENYIGMWQSIVSIDYDKDGDVDLVLGNIGDNFYLKADSANPVKIWINDFDNNQTRDKIVTRTYNGKDVPVFTKREITDQLPGLKKQNLKHHEYAKNTFTQLFPSASVKNALVKQFNYGLSAIAYNDGNGNFTLKALPVEVQLSSVNSILVHDLNSDGLPDLLMGGNRFGLLPQFSRLDASYGHVIINNGKGGFAIIDPAASGIETRGEVKGIIYLKSKKYFLFLQNNNQPLMYRWQTP